MASFLHRAALVAAALVAGCSGAPWNNPHPVSQSGGNILYSSFSERPKHLDPVQSYSSNEYAFIGNIYQPPLQYHYFKRPYELIPYSATEVPRAQFYDASGRRLPDTAHARDVAYSDYVIHIRPGILYQPHPALATDEQGRHAYHDLQPGDLDGIHAIGDFRRTGTRELVAADYVHQLKRLAHPRLHSPIMQLMGEYIVGLKELARELAESAKTLPRGGFLDLTRHEVSGVQVLDRHTYRIRVRGKYPQFVYWLAMPFFSPVPPEADRFYAQPGMAEKNITLDWFPVGTGPYMLTVNNPNRQMVLERNPNYRGETYPGEGEPGDAEAGLLRDAGKSLPFIDKIVYSLEKEQIPYWNKFLQGYYDASGISSDTFDQAVQFTGQGDVTLSDDMKKQGITLLTSVSATVFYLGFNMLDPDVGGSTERGRKLRHAISIAIDQEEFISIFRNGRGIPSQGPIPPGIFGYREGREGINPYVYEWADGAPRRKSIEQAKALLAEAGYPNGRDAKTGQPLLLNLDTTATGPDAKARLDWYAKQFQKLGVQLAIRATDWNRFQDKVRKGNVQMYFLGWHADYPDPENFLFLLHGPQSKVRTSGENASNYENAEFDRLFEQMKNMYNSPERQRIIDRMVEILRHDAPWVWSFFPKDYTLHHAWVHNRKPNEMANNGLKYQRVDPALRDRMRREWNQPVLWPLAVLAAVLAVSLVPAVLTFRRRERQTAKA
ncbi:MAG: peptide ABC transporter substrate-binding protein [Betaproteobacteria bacterium]|nr:peptide ABC transporter substrate-binding protein [Betaproteobacteria bacterium]